MNRETQLAIFGIAANLELLTSIVVEGLSIVRNAEVQEGGEEEKDGKIPRIIQVPAYGFIPSSKFSVE
jgi:hypothetical protein